MLASESLSRERLPGEPSAGTDDLITLSLFSGVVVGVSSELDPVHSRSDDPDMGELSRDIVPVTLKTNLTRLRASRGTNPLTSYALGRHSGICMRKPHVMAHLQD